MKSFLFVVATMAALTMHASHGAESTQVQPAMPGTSSGNAAVSTGEVRSVDLMNKTVTVDHGGISSLGIPPSATELQIKDVALLGKLKVGDKIRFRATKVADHVVATKVEPAE